jgi:hypothetical protein
MRTKSFVIALLLGWLTQFGDVVQAQDSWTFPNFSATQVFSSHRADMTMKIYRSGSSVRVERSGAISTLYVPASSQVFNLTVYPDNTHQCVAMKPDQAKMLPSPLELILGQIVKRTPAGSEVVDGHSSKIEDVTVIEPDGKTVESRVWEAEDLKGIPVKIESHLDGVTLRATYRDVVIGPPDETLFRVPDRCIPFEKMGQVAESRVLN